MTLLGTLGSASTGAAKTIASVARKAYNGTKQTAKNTGRIMMSTPKSILGGLKDIMDPEDLLTAAVGDNRLGQNIVKRIFEDKRPNTEETDVAKQSQEPDVPLLTGEVLDKLTQIDDDIVDLKNSLIGHGKSIEKMIYDTTATQTIILTKGDGYNIISDVVKTIFNPIGLPGPQQERIVPTIPQLLEHKPSISTTAISHNNVAEILAREDDREDDQVAKQQADDIHAIREHIEKQSKQNPSTETKEKTIIEKMTDKLLGNDIDIDIDRKDKSSRGRRGRRSRTKPSTPAKSMMSRAGSTIRALPATISSGMSNIGTTAMNGARTVGTAAKPVLSGAMSAGKGAMSALGGLGAGTLAAGTAALLFGGTGLYSAYKAAKGEDASNWISNLVDKGVQYVSGDENATLGTKLYDIINGDENTTNITNPSIVKTPQQPTIEPDENTTNITNPSIVKTPQQPTIEPAKDKVISELVSKQEQNNSSNTFSTSTVTISTSASSDKSTFIKEPEPLPDAKRLEANKIETEKASQNQAPVIINNQQAAPQKQQMTPGHGGGQSVAPMITRPTDSSLNRVTDKMIGGSL